MTTSSERDVERETQAMSEATPNQHGAAGPEPEPEPDQEPSFPSPPACVWLENRSPSSSTPPVIAQLQGPGGASLPTQEQTAKRRKLTQSDNVPGRNFWRKAKWSPDASLILAQSESHRVSIIRLNDDQSLDGTEPRLSLELKRLFKAPSPLLDVVWYPIPAYGLKEASCKDQAQSQVDVEEQSSPEYTTSWCYAQSSRDMPIKLVDSTDGSIKASYAIMDHVERFVSPHSLAFSLDQTRLYCGEWSQLSVYPLADPGLNRHSRLPLVHSRSASGEGQRGFVSALSVAPGLIESTDEYAVTETVAIGTFAGSVGLYQIDPALLAPPLEHNARSSTRHLTYSSACIAGWTEPAGSGIHQLSFHPLAPHILFVSSRRSGFINVYDTRYLIGGARKLDFREKSSPALIAKLPRGAESTHQRLWYDVDWAGRWLAAGDEEGHVSVWRIDRGLLMGMGADADDKPTSDSEPVRPASKITSAAVIQPDANWQAHQGEC